MSRDDSGVQVDPQPTAPVVRQPSPSVRELCQPPKQTGPVDNLSVAHQQLHAMEAPSATSRVHRKKSLSLLVAIGAPIAASMAISGAAIAGLPVVKPPAEPVEVVFSEHSAPSVDTEAKEPERAAREEFKQDALVEYRKLQAEHQNISIADLLKAAQTETKGTTRAALGFLTIEKAIRDGDLKSMNAALDVVVKPDRKTGYEGMHEQDAIGVQENLLKSYADRIRFDAQERAALMHQLIEQTWIAYRYKDYALASDLIKRAGELSRGLSAHGIRDKEERIAIVRAITAARKAVMEARSRTEEFTELANAAASGNITAEGMLNIKQDGDWERALPHLAQSDNTAVARAVPLDAAITANSSAIEVLSAAEAWRAAAASDRENRDYWNGRANILLQEAQKRSENTGGAAGLAFTASASKLSRQLRQYGVDAESLLGVQGFVVGRKMKEREKEKVANNTSSPSNASETVNLLEDFKIPKKDVSRWRLQNGVLALKGGSHATIQLPTSLEAGSSYALQLDVAKNGTHMANVILPVAGRKVMVVLDHHEKNLTGLAQIAGRAIARYHNNDVANSLDFTDGKIYPVHVQVSVSGDQESASIILSIQGRRAAVWQGSVKDLGLHKSWASRAGGATDISVGAGGKTSASFQNIQLSILP